MKVLRKGCMVVLVFLFIFNLPRCSLGMNDRLGKEKKVVAEKRGVYKCLYTTTPIEIDGLLDDSPWQKAGALGFILLGENKEPISKTEAKLLWDKNYLYIAFKAYDEDIWGYYNKRDDPLYREDVLELFFKTNPDKNPYYEFEWNPLNTIFDALIPKRHAYGNLYRITRWNVPGLKSAVKITGTLNKWDDKDTYWTLEAAIPFASMPTLKGEIPEQGDKWIFHVARIDYSVYLPEGRELSSCAQLSKNSFH